MTAFADAVAAVRAVDQRAAAAAREHHARLTKPLGSLGRVEDLGAQLAAIAGTSPPPVPSPVAVAVFAGDHGVLAQGVSPWPQEVTAQMVANFATGGAAINVLARAAGAAVTVVDVGVAGDISELTGVVHRKVRRGTADLTVAPAMQPNEAAAALDVGAGVAADLVAGGARCLVTGDMGIGNTTPSAALVAALTGRAVRDVTGRGSGVDEEVWGHKVGVIEAALARHGDDRDPMAVLASLGGLEHAALVGFIVGGAAAGVPVVVDGVIAGAALLVAARLAPAVVGWCIAGHRSVEPAAAAVLAELGLDPVLDLDLRLGEGTGAVLAVPVIQAAAHVLREMATFDGAGVSDKVR